MFIGAFPNIVSEAKFYLNFETIKKMRQMREHLSEEDALMLLSEVRFVLQNCMLHTPANRLWFKNVGKRIRARICSETRRKSKA
jgi:hypothetical protein